MRDCLSSQVEVTREMLSDYISLDADTSAEQQLSIDFPSDGVIISVDSMDDNYKAVVTVSRTFYSGDLSQSVDTWLKKTVSSQCTISVVPMGKSSLGLIYITKSAKY